MKIMAWVLLLLSAFLYLLLVFTNCQNEQNKENKYNSFANIFLAVYFLLQILFSFAYILSC